VLKAGLGSRVIGDGISGGLIEFITRMMQIFRAVGEIVRSHPSAGVRDVIKFIAGYGLHGKGYLELYPVCRRGCIVGVCALRFAQYSAERQLQDLYLVSSAWCIFSVTNHSVAEIRCFVRMLSRPLLGNVLLLMSV
jgi:hypothetical protein